MAAWFVDSVQGIAGLQDGTSWANAYLTLAAALTAKAAGDTFWVGDDHAETQASAMTLTSPGTVGNPCFVYCVDHTKASPGTGDLKTTATITTTGNSALTKAGIAYCFGVIFNCGSGATTPTFTIGSSWALESCSLRSLASGANVNAFTLSGSKVSLKSTTFQFGAAGNSIRVSSGQLEWKNTATAILGATLPTNLFGTNMIGNALLEGIDLSALGSGKTLVAAPASTGSLFLKDCQLGASVTVSGTPTVLGPETYLIRSDSGATNYRNEKYSYPGTETTETTITRTGGASDGTTAQSRKIVTTANSKWVLPFNALPIAIWNDTTSANVTVTVFGIWGGGAVPNNDDIWIDVEYLGAAGNPLGSFGNSTKANNLAASVALSSDSSTWGGSTTAFKMTVTLSAPQPLQKGTIYVYVKAAKASSTFYIDPLVVLS